MFITTTNNSSAPMLILSASVLAMRIAIAWLLSLW